MRSPAVSDNTLGPLSAATAVGARRGRRRGPRRSPTPPRTLPDHRKGQYYCPTTSAGHRGADRSAYGGRFGSIGGQNLMVERLANVVGSSRTRAVGGWSSPRYFSIANRIFDQRYLFTLLVETHHMNFLATAFLLRRFYTKHTKKLTVPFHLKSV